MAINGIARHPKPCTQHHPRPLLETASFHHLKEVSVNVVPRRPMRTRHGYKVDGKVCEVVGRERGYEGE